MDNFNFLLATRTYNEQNWSKLQVATMEVVKSFQDEYKIGEIDEVNKTIIVKIIKVPFYDGIDIFLECSENNNNISVNYKIDDSNIVDIKKVEAQKLVKELDSNIYSSFSKTLYLTAKNGELKEKRDIQINSGNAIIQFILLAASIGVIFFSIKTCSSI